jgi:hypothetical protein
VRTSVEGECVVIGLGTEAKSSESSPRVNLESCDHGTTLPSPAIETASNSTIFVAGNAD